MTCSDGCLGVVAETVRMNVVHNNELDINTHRYQPQRQFNTNLDQLPSIKYVKIKCPPQINPSTQVLRVSPKCQHIRIKALGYPHCATV